MDCSKNLVVCCLTNMEKFTYTEILEILLVKDLGGEEHREEEEKKRVAPRKQIRGNALILNCNLSQSS